MEDRHAELSARMDQFDTQMAENTAITRKIKEDTSEFLEVFEAMKGGFRVIGWIGAGAKWAASLGAAAIGLYWAIKMGPRP